QTLNKYDIQRLPWTEEIKDRISVFNESVDEFLDVFVPGPGPSKWPPKKSLKYGFKNGDTKGKEVEKYPNMMRRIGGLRNIVQDFQPSTKPGFAEGSRCRVPFPFEAWDEDRHYAMPDIIMSLPGNSDAKWARTWTGISTVFEVRPDGLEDPVDEDSATIRTKALPTYGLIQIAKSARNLLHTHRLLYAYVVCIYGDKARIYRFDHAAGVVSKAIDLKKDPYPLYDFLWRFCHSEHGGQPASASPQAPGLFLGTDPTISPASEADCNKVDELLQTSSPPQKRLTKEERKSCRWVAVVTEYNPDGSAKTTKRYIMYRFRFVTPRVFSRATRVSDAYEAETWEQRAIKDAWRQLARDREDVLYDQLRDELRYRDDLEKLVEDEADLNSLALGEADRPPVYDVYHRTISTWSFRKWRNIARFYERSHMRLVMKTVGRPLSSFKSTKEMVTAIRDALIGHMLAFKAGMIHRDLNEGNVMIHDGGIFTGFLLDLDFAGPREPPTGRVVDKRASWSQRTKRVERTGTLSFTAAQLLDTYCAHDVRHDLESAVWLLLSTVLRHTVPVNIRLQRERDRYALYSEHFEANTEHDMHAKKISFIFWRMYWEVRGNKPLNQLIRDLRILLLIAYDPFRDDEMVGPRMPLMYQTVLSAFNGALASSDWPENDAALPFNPP
ncbi:hypothetical protein FOMPIDRAFT_37343, partial [Fomitopsis schrenkii]